MLWRTKIKLLCICPTCFFLSLFVQHFAYVHFVPFALAHTTDCVGPLAIARATYIVADNLCEDKTMFTQSYQ